MGSTQTRLTLKVPLFLISIVAIYALSGLMQSTILFNWDASWLIHVTERLLAGGTYTKDFFEINPPMILYLYIPVVLLAKYAKLSNMAALYYYLFTLASVSLLLCYYLIQKMFHKSQITRYFFFLSIVISYLILPVFEFGQREPIMLMLVMPYFLLSAYRLQGNTPSTKLALIIGIMAGCGFALKPYFFITLVLVELYYLYKRHGECHASFRWHDTQNARRIETITLFLIAIIYLLSVLLFHLDYLTTIIPIVRRTYYSGFDFSWGNLSQHIAAVFSYFVIGFYFLTRTKNIQQILSDILLLALFGFILSYFLQHTLWHYHIFPMYAVAFILGTLLLSEHITQFYSKKDWPLITGYTTIFLAIPILYTFLLYHFALEYKQTSQPIITFLNTYANQKRIYMMSSSTVFMFPIIDYTNANYISRVESLGWVRSIAKKRDPKWEEDSRFLVNMTVDDINTKKPDYIFVDVLKNKAYLNDVKFEYLNFFSQFPSFNKAWSQYHYFTTLNNDPVYKFDVYIRK